MSRAKKALRDAVNKEYERKMGLQKGVFQVKWNCGHVVPVESAGWKACPSCMQEKINNLEEKNKRLLDCYDITASVSAMERAKDFNYWAGSKLTWRAVKKLAEHFSVLEGAQT